MTLIGKPVTVELRNGVKVKGILDNVDTFANIQLTEIEPDNPHESPHISLLESLFIRGTAVRYIHLPKDEVDKRLLAEATMINFSQCF